MFSPAISIVRDLSMATPGDGCSLGVKSARSMKIPMPIPTARVVIERVTLRMGEVYGDDARPDQRNFQKLPSRSASSPAGTPSHPLAPIAPFAPLAPYTPRPSRERLDKTDDGLDHLVSCEQLVIVVIGVGQDTQCLR